MNDIESIIEAICAETKKDRYEIKKLIEDKQRKFNRQISETAAARLVATELNVQISSAKKTPVNIVDLHHTPPGTPNISIVGIVARVYTPITFQKDQGVGKVQNLLLMDNSGSIKIILWGNLIELAQKNKLVKGSIIEVFKGILKMGREGERELHLNELSTIQIDPSTYSKKDFPDVFATVLTPDILLEKDISQNDVDIKGIIAEISEIRHFKKADGAESQLQSLELVGKTKKVRTIIWGERTQDNTPLKFGDEILIEGASIKKDRANIPEIHVNRRTNILLLGENCKVPDEFISTNTNINTYTRRADNNSGKNIPTMSNTGTIRPGTIEELKKENNLQLTLRVAFLQQINTFSRSDGTIGKNIRTGVFDNTGSNYLVLWDTNAEKISEWGPNVLIDVSPCYLRDDSRGGKEIAIGRSGEVKLVPTDNKTIPDLLPLKQIKDITSSWRIISVAGKFTEISETREFTRQKDNSIGQVRWGQFSDSSGSIRIVTWNDKVVELDNVPVNEPVEVHHVVVRMQEAGQELHMLAESRIEGPNTFSIPLPAWVMEESHLGPPKYPMINNSANYQRINLNSLSLDRPNIEFRARVIQIGDKQPIYFGCPECGRKIADDQTEQKECTYHGLQTPIPKFRIPVLLDDGTGTIYISILGRTAELMTGITQEMLTKLVDSDEEFITQVQESLLGHEYVFQGSLNEKHLGEQEERTTWEIKVQRVYSPNTVYELNLLYQAMSIKNS